MRSSKSVYDLTQTLRQRQIPISGIGFYCPGDRFHRFQDNYSNIGDGSSPQPVGSVAGCASFERTACRWFSWINKVTLDPPGILRRTHYFWYSCSEAREWVVGWCAQQSVVLIVSTTVYGWRLEHCNTMWDFPGTSLVPEIHSSKDYNKVLLAGKLTGCGVLLGSYWAMHEHSHVNNGTAHCRTRNMSDRQCFWSACNARRCLRLAFGKRKVFHWNDIFLT